MIAGSPHARFPMVVVEADWGHLGVTHSGRLCQCPCASSSGSPPTRDMVVGCEESIGPSQPLHDVGWKKVETFCECAVEIRVHVCAVRPYHWLQHGSFRFGGRCRVKTPKTQLWKRDELTAEEERDRIDASRTRTRTRTKTKASKSIC